LPAPHWQPKLPTGCRPRPGWRHCWRWQPFWAVVSAL
jgi:hypothetical protein